MSLNKTFHQVKKVIKYYQQNTITRETNESILHVRESTLRLCSQVRKVFGVQLYKNNARALLSRILNIVNSDWLQHAHSVRWEYEFPSMNYDLPLSKPNLPPEAYTSSCLLMLDFSTNECNTFNTLWTFQICVKRCNKSNISEHFWKPWYHFQMHWILEYRPYATNHHNWFASSYWYLNWPQKVVVFVTFYSKHLWLEKTSCYYLQIIKKKVR